MKKITTLIIVLFISKISLSQRISSNDLDYFLNVSNSVYENEISKRGFHFERTTEYLKDEKTYNFKKFQNEQTGEWIERLYWAPNKVQISYSFIGVESQKNSNYKKFKNDFLFDEYILIHEAVTDEPGPYASNTIKATFKKSNGIRVSLDNSFTTRRFSNSNKKDDYTHWISIYISNNSQ